MDSIFEPGRHPIWFDRTCTAHPYFMSKGHYHDYYEIYCLIQGETRYQVGDEVWTLKPGDVMLIPKGVLHNTSNLNHDYTERVLVNFTDIVLPQASKMLQCFDHRLISLSSKNQECLQDLLLKIEAEQKKGDLLSQELMYAYLWELLILFSRSLRDEKPRPTIEDPSILPIKQYIDEHWQESITLTELGQRFAISPCHLSKKFRKCMGFGLHEYIELVRMMHAEHMLIKSKCTVTQIAESCGFSNANYFSSVFKRIHGYSPKTYQKQYTKK